MEVERFWLCNDQETQHKMGNGSQASHSAHHQGYSSSSKRFNNVPLLLFLFWSKNYGSEAFSILYVSFSSFSPPWTVLAAQMLILQQLQQIAVVVAAAPVVAAVWRLQIYQILQKLLMIDYTKLSSGVKTCQYLKTFL